MKLLNLNIFRGYHTQFHNKYNWKNRRNQLKEFVRVLKPDIILFQECNKLKHNESVEEFMFSIPEYNYSIYYSYPNIYRSRALIIGYNPLVVFKTNEMIRWLSDTPDIPSDSWGLPGDNYGRIIVGNKFIKVVNDKPTNDYFWIFNTHFDVNYSSIIGSIKLLPPLINEFINNDNAKVIIAGDFNTDMEILFKSFKKYGFLHQSNDLITLDDKLLRYTFIGKRDENGDLEEFLYLDHIFGKNITKKKIYCPFSYDFIFREYTMSDHLPIVFDFDL